MQDFADVEAFGGVYGVDEDVSVDVDRVLRGEDGELVLPRRVHKQNLVVVPVDAQLLVKCWKKG